MSDKTDNKISITLDIEIPDQLCADILCTMLEGGVYGIGYWACADNIQRTPGYDDPERKADWNYVSAELSDAEHDEDDPDSKPQFEPKTMDYALIRKGIAACLAPGANLNKSTQGYIFSGVVNKDGGDIDGDAADAIAQFAMFGKLVYG